MDIKKAIKKVASFKDLTERETYLVFNSIMSGKAAPSQIGALLIALRMKGEAVSEITGAAKVMRKKSVKIKTNTRLVLDTCGTGGSELNAFNISTASAFVVAGCGVKVAKHGNRSASSRCGSADVLEALGVRVDVSARITEKSINTIGIGFMFAPLFHSAMKHAASPRRELGVRTIFNVLGPLCNPASASYQVLGVYDDKLTSVVANVLKNLGSKRAFVVSGSDSLDEVTITGKTRISELKNGKVRSFSVTPKDFGLKKGTLSSIRGGSSIKNANIIERIFSGEKSPRRDIVLMNASLGLVAVGKAKNFKEGAILAAEAIDSGKVQEELESFIRLTNK